MRTLLARYHSRMRAGRRGAPLSDEQAAEFRRPARGSLRISPLDLRLAGRMLVKHPALTVVATIAVAFAIAVGTVGFEVARQALWPTLPLPDGNAIVALRNWNVAENEAAPASRRDYELWREGISTITTLAAVAVEERSVAVGAGAGQPETVASVTASAFELTRVPALMGRTLLETDERGGGDAVVVVGYDFWKNRLAGAPDVIGRVIGISGTPVTIVGVMPRGYGFPQRNGIWRPLQLERLPAASPSLQYVFGRLAPGHRRDEANAQATAIGDRAATMFPETNRNVRLHVLTLPEVVSDLPDEAAVVLASVNVFLVLLAALLCGNVAMLLFARAVSRERELLVRAALGASRGRLIMQLFAEALLLCAIGAGVGLMVARIVLARTWAMVEGQTGPLPFYIDTSLSTTTMLYAVGLTLCAATIAGVIPALKVTFGGAAARLRAASGGGGGLQFGGVWTVVIVAQIALTTMLPVPLIGVGADVLRDTPAGFAADAFLTATLELDRLDGIAASGDTVPAQRAARLETRYGALADRLRQEPGVLGVTYADQMPQVTSGWRTIELDPGPAAEPSDGCVGCYHVGGVSVDPRFFEVIGAPVIRGRALTTADAEHGLPVVLVNQVFVDQVMGGGNPVGRRVRFASKGEPATALWHDVVGVVPDLSVSDKRTDLRRARIYQARLPRETGPLRIAIHVRGDPERLTVRLRELAQATDPALRVIAPVPLPHLVDHDAPGMAYVFELLVSLAGLTLMLSLAGVYAVTSFAVSRRTREIGVRVALGAQPLHVLATVFKRPMAQIALGIGIGAILALGLANNDVADVHLDDVGNSAAYALATILCCAFAAMIPTRRALRIQPTQALQDDG